MNYQARNGKSDHPNEISSVNNQYQDVMSNINW